MMRLVILALAIGMVFSRCADADKISEHPLFLLLSPKETNIHFSNDITESDSLNILTYEYIYNGGGVGVIDINNDDLPDLFFTGNQVPNALYLNKGNFIFEDISASSGIRLEHDWCTGVSIVDVNADGFDDIYVSVGGSGNKSVFTTKLFINQHDLTFRESAAEYGLAEPAESIQAAFFDFDLDGDLDMYQLIGGGFENSAIVARPIMEHGENRNTDRLYENEYDSAIGHPVFKNISAQAGILLEGFGLGVSILDANQDRWPDVYVSNDYLSRDVLYINNHDGTFTDKALEYFKHTSHFSMGNDVGDINNDGLPDIIAVDMLPENYQRRKRMYGPDDRYRFSMAVERNYGYQYMRNTLHLNHGHEGFSEIGQLAGIDKTDWSWAPLLADFDNDGLQDVYITNGFGKDITDLDFVKFRNDLMSPFASDNRLKKILQDSLQGRPAIDLPDFVFKNKGDLTFANRCFEWGITQSSISNGAAYSDLDRDGDLDLIVNNINKKAFIYKNTQRDRDSLSSHFLQIKLEGPTKNVHGLGTEVLLFSNGRKQMRCAQVVRGFLSCSDKIIHFGLASENMIDSIVVSWNDGKQGAYKKITADQVLTIRYADAIKVAMPSENSDGFLAESNILEYTHAETQLNDFVTQPLLQHGFSNEGPGIAVGDVNGDGLDDAFIGGGYQSEGSLFIQSKDGFDQHMIPTENFEDAGAVFFDADGDDDLDLYIASGGAERYTGHTGYEDHLYMNNGKGNFTLSENALPSMLVSSSAVAAGDFDQDGDLDLFVGGRVSPGEFPKTPSSYVLENQSGRFSDVTDQVNPSIRNIGMVTSALWTDFNNDSKPDLILVGEMMRITLLKNNGSRLIDITTETALKESHGMWNSIQSGDFDNDGDMDYIAGNIGFNTPFKISDKSPLHIHYADFDKNGSIDPIYAAYEDGISYPVASLDQLAQQIPKIKKNLLHYRDFANTNTDELLSYFEGAQHETLSCKVATTSFIENIGNDQFKIVALPIEAQFSKVYGIAVEDLNTDGQLDVILIGNSYATEVVHGRYDASIGRILLNSGGNAFKSLDFNTQQPVIAQGDAKAIARLELASNQSLLICTQNNDKTKGHIIKAFNKLKKIKATSNETGAIISFSDQRTRKIEFQIGGGYLAQNSKTIVVTPEMESIRFLDSKGEETRKISCHNFF